MGGTAPQVVLQLIGPCFMSTSNDFPPRPQNPLPPCVPFLPQDNDAAASDPTAVQVVSLLNDSLSQLLRCGTYTFWAHLHHDSSVSHALDTYLQFRERPHDVCIDGPTTSITSADELSLSRRVFFVFRRIGDLGENGSESVPLHTRTAIIQNRGLVTPSTIFDLVALFGPDNVEGTRDLVRDLVTVAVGGECDDEQSSIGSEFANAGTLLSKNLNEMADRVVSAAIETGGLDSGSKNDALRYFHDVAASLEALSAVSPALAARCKGGSSNKFERQPVPDLTGKGKAPVVELPSDTALGFVACEPNALCDALHRAANETCVAICGVEASDGAFSQGSSTSGSFASAANAVRVALERAKVALEHDGGAKEETRGTRVRDTDEPSSSSHLSSTMPAEVKQRVDEARELFPDYGEGFLASALECFDNDVGTLASYLFEGDLPHALVSVDHKQTWSEYWNAKNPTVSSQPSQTKQTQNSVWRNPPTQINENDSLGREYQKNGDTKYMTRHQKSVFGLEQGYDSSLAKKTILNLQYEDEYDDSFDELNELAGVSNESGESENIAMGFGKQSIWSAPNTHTPKNTQSAQQTKQFWIDNGRVYHSARAGATVVMAGSVEEASLIAARDAEVSAAQVYGLGAGGNRARFDAVAAPFAPVVRGRGGRGRGLDMPGGRVGRGDGSSGQSSSSNLRVPDPRPAPGATTGLNRRGSGAPAGTRAHKNEHKASLGNHNRKQQAQKKVSKGSWPANGGE
mgnify:CR=1 FL=1